MYMAGRGGGGEVDSKESYTDGVMAILFRS